MRESGKAGCLKDPKSSHFELIGFRNDHETTFYFYVYPFEILYVT
jgi:hypothetical protein